jgi:hypothetical protein
VISKIRAAVAVLVMSVCLLAPAEAMSATRSATISGSIAGGRNYIVIVTTKNGGGVRRKLNATGSFRIVLPAAKAAGASLTIVRPSGRYLGPVVLRHRDRLAYTRLTGTSIALGQLRLRAGYATPGRMIPDAAVNLRSAVAADRTGKPVGAGLLGFVRRFKFKSSRLDPLPVPQGADTDTDGIPNNFDIDDDGDKVLDASDVSSGSGNSDPVKVFTNLRGGSLRDTVNVNALPAGTDITAAQDALLASSLNMVFLMNQANAGLTGLTAVNIDCGLLAYCARGTGTATTVQGNPPDPGAPADGSLWRDFDPDSDGYPNLPNASQRFNNGGTWFDLSTRPSTSRAKINAGDTFTFLGTASNGVNAFATSLPPYFVTTPAIHTIVDAASTHTIGYPITDSQPGVGGGGPNQPPPPSPNMALASDLVTISFWRPQRNSVAGAETGTFRDMGRLGYFFQAASATCTKDDIK